MKYLILSGIFFCTFFLSFAQDNYRTKVTMNTQSVVRINLLGVPAFSFEKGLGNNFTFRPEAGLGWPVITSEQELNSLRLTVESLVNPYLLIEGRYYYNLQKRFIHGKKTDNYGANYLAVFYRYSAYEYQAGLSDHNRDESGKLLRDVQYIGVWWGLQRNLWKKQRFYINWSLGPSIKTNWLTYADFSLTSQLGFGLQWE